MPTVEYALCIYVYSFFVYLCIYLFIGLSGSTVQSMIVYGVNLFTYAWNATCCLRIVVESPYCNQLLFTAYSMNRIKLLMRQL